MKRRKFIEDTVLTAAGIGIASSLPLKASEKYVQPSDTFNVALVGCNSMGFGILDHHLSNPGVRCVAMCDVDSSVLNDRASEVSRKYNQTPKLFGDFRKLLDEKDIDAVIIGTPDHWHCLITVFSLQAGKNVYVEKPMANSIAECNLIVKAAKYYKKIVQVGQQQRSGAIFKSAMDMIKGGKIGRLRKVDAWANFNYGVGLPVIPDQPVPANVDFDMWLGPAPLRSFNPNRFHGVWRMFWDYGGGLNSDWGVHLLDVALWAKDQDTPPDKVMVYADNTYHEQRMRETFDSMTVVFPKKDYVINWHVTAGLQRGPFDMPYGLSFVGDDATIVMDRSKLVLYPEWDEDLKRLRVEEYKFTEGKESHGDHVKNFIASVTKGEKQACPPETGRAAALHVHIANIAGRTGESVLLWDDGKNCFSNSSAANNLITPVYRKPWTLPVF